jgi:hypothetical protein
VTDPYVYPGTAVLRNRAELRDGLALSEREAQSDGKVVLPNRRRALAQAPPAIAGRMTRVSLSPTAVSRPSSTRTSSSLR